MHKHQLAGIYAGLCLADYYASNPDSTPVPFQDLLIEYFEMERKNIKSFSPFRQRMFLLTKEIAHQMCK